MWLEMYLYIAEKLQTIFILRHIRFYDAFSSVGIWVVETTTYARKMKISLGMVFVMLCVFLIFLGTHQFA